MAPVLERNLMAGLRRRLRPSRFLRGEGPEPGPITLDRSRVFIMPTRYGVGYAAVLLTLLLGSLNYGNNPGIALTFLLGSLALVSIFHTYRNLSRLTLRAGKPEPVFAGQEAMVVFDSFPEKCVSMGEHIVPKLLKRRCLSSTAFPKRLLLGRVCFSW
jgi:hypothetical protein